MFTLNNKSSSCLNVCDHALPDFLLGNYNAVIYL